MNHPLMLLCPGSSVSLSTRSLRTVLLVLLTLLALVACFAGGEAEETHRQPAPEMAVTIVSATTVPSSDCGPGGTECRS